MLKLHSMYVPSGYYRNAIFTELTSDYASANLATENPPSKHPVTSDYSLFGYVRKRGSKHTTDSSCMYTLLCIIDYVKICQYYFIHNI